MNSPDAQHTADWSGFDRLLAFPLQQALEAKHAIALVTTTTAALLGGPQRQSIESVRSMSDSHRWVFEQPRDDRTRTVEVGATAGPEPRATPKPTATSDGDPQPPQQSTESR